MALKTYVNYGTVTQNATGNISPMIYNLNYNNLHCVWNIINNAPVTYVGNVNWSDSKYYICRVC